LWLINLRLKNWEKMMIESVECEQMISSIKAATGIKKSFNQNILKSP